MARIECEGFQRDNKNPATTISRKTSFGWVVMERLFCISIGKMAKTVGNRCDRGEDISHTRRNILQESVLWKHKT